MVQQLKYVLYLSEKYSIACVCRDVLPGSLQIGQKQTKVQTGRNEYLKASCGFSLCVLTLGKESRIKPHVFWALYKVHLFWTPVQSWTARTCCSDAAQVPHTGFAHLPLGKLYSSSYLVPVSEGAVPAVFCGQGVGNGWAGDLAEFLFIWIRKQNSSWFNRLNIRLFDTLCCFLWARRSLFLP